MKIAAIALICTLTFTSVQGFNVLSGLRRGLSEQIAEVQLYSQCGGKGVACNATGGVGQCKDQAWTTVRCPANSACVRQSDHYWMCSPTAAAPSSTPTAEKKLDKPTKGEDGVTTIPAWTQCGGSEGDCEKYGSPDEACVDCPFPRSRCEAGYVCYKVVEFYWQCGPEAQYGSAALQCEGRDSGAAAPAPGPSSAAAAAERTCEAPQDGYAVQGKRFKAITLATSESNYEDCCASCTSEPTCVAFHINKKSDDESICALFNEFTDVVQIDRAVAGLITGAAASIAG